MKLCSIDAVRCTTGQIMDYRKVLYSTMFLARRVLRPLRLIQRPRSWVLYLAIYACAESSLSDHLFASPLNQDLLKRGAVIRETLSSFPSLDDLFFSSAYEKNDGSGTRGFCNWIIPDKVMLGQYPGRNPEETTPTSEDVENHLGTLINAGVNLFGSLQSEIPSQEDYSAWEEAGGEIFLPERDDFPNPFSHYAPIVRFLDPECKFIHAPIVDLFVPKSDSFEKLLMDLLQAIGEDGRCVYIHCWGGRGRAGLVGACLLSVIFPELDAVAILGLIQGGYDTRLGSHGMPTALSKSPQTGQQRVFVKDFVERRRRMTQKR
jgi:hypothetical protein